MALSRPAAARAVLAIAVALCAAALVTSTVDSRPSRRPAGTGAGDGADSDSRPLYVPLALNGRALRVDVVGQIGAGRVTALARSGDLVAVALGPQIVTLRMAEGNEPVRLGETPPMTGTVRALALAGDRLYAVRTVGEGIGATLDLQVADLSDPSRPRWRARLPLRSSGFPPFAILADGAWAYVTTGHALKIVDARDPDRPRLQPHANLDVWRPVALARHDRYLVMASERVGFGVGVVTVLDLALPGQPRFVGELVLGSRARELALRWPYAFVAVENHRLTPPTPTAEARPTERAASPPPPRSEQAGSNGLVVVDLSDPIRPRQIGSVDLPKLSGLWALGDETVVVGLDHVPRRLVAYRVPVQRPAEWAPATPMQERTLLADETFVGADGNRLIIGGTGRLVTWTFGANAEPIARLFGLGSWPLDHPYGLAHAGRELYVFDGYGKKLQAWDVTNPIQPTRRTDVSANPLTPLRRLSVIGRHGYGCSADYGNVLAAVDLDTLSPGLLGDRACRGLTASGRRLFAFGRGAGTDSVLTAYEVASPQTLQALGAIDLPVEDAAVTSGLAFVVGRCGAGLLALCLTAVTFADPLRPAVLGVVQLEPNADGRAPLVVAGGGQAWAYTRVPARLRAFDVTDPGRMRPLGQLDFESPEVATLQPALALVDGRLFAASAHRLRVLDVSEPARPRLLASLGLPSADGLGLVLIDRHAYLATSDGVWIVDATAAWR
jgi:hypothetical protein